MIKFKELQEHLDSITTKPITEEVIEDIMPPADNLREKYISGGLFVVGDIVVHKQKQSIHEIVSCGANYLSVINEHGIISKMWIDDAVNANSLSEDFQQIRRKRSSSNQIAFVGYKTKNFTTEIYDTFKPLVKEKVDKFVMLNLLKSTDELAEQINNISEDTIVKLTSLFERTERYLTKFNQLDQHAYRKDWADKLNSFVETLKEQS